MGASVGLYLGHENYRLMGKRERFDPFDILYTTYWSIQNVCFRMIMIPSITSWL